MEQTGLFRRFAKYAWLSVCGMIGLSFYILADTFFVAQGLGSSGLAALNLAIPVYNGLAGVGQMLGMGGAIKYAILKSQNEEQRANVLFTNTMLLAAGSSVLFVLAGLFASDWITAALGADAQVYAMTRVYLRTLCLFAPAFMLNYVLQSFVRNDGAPQLAMAALISGSLVNVVLDYVFIFPCGMGMFGAVLATGFSPVTGILIMLPYWFGSRRGFRFVKTGLVGDQVRSILSLGFPTLIGQLSSGITIITFNTIMLRLAGNLGVAAYGVITNIALVVASVYNGIGQGIQPLISESYGRNRMKEARQVLAYAMITMAAVSGLLYVCLWGYAEPIAEVFNSEHLAELRQRAAEGMKLYFLSNLFLGFNTILAMFFAATERVIPAHVLSLLRGLFLIVPAAFFMAYAWGLTGVWLAVPVTEGTVAILGAAVYLGKKRDRARRREPG
ncbi:MAG TPA: MATE family efflux transporter [Candidatus Ventrimonas merdavium]|nr:MATE family efflux transporter [Candidatus Ventrimonas merdavium]